MADTKSAERQSESDKIQTAPPRLLRVAVAWLPIFAGVLPLLAIIFGGLFTAYKYFDEQRREERKLEFDKAALQQKVELERVAIQRAEQGERAKQLSARLLEIQRPFIDRQTSLYFETAAIIGKLMTIKPDDAAWDAVERRYWALYWSELAMVEHCEVAGAMENFGNEIEEYKEQYLKQRNIADSDKLGENALEVAHALRSGMAKTWSGQLPAECNDDDDDNDNDSKADVSEKEPAGDALRQALGPTRTARPHARQ